MTPNDLIIKVLTQHSMKVEDLWYPETNKHFNVRKGLIHTLDFHFPTVSMPVKAALINGSSKEIKDAHEEKMEFIPTTRDQLGYMAL